MNIQKSENGKKRERNENEGKSRVTVHKTHYKLENSWEMIVEASFSPLLEESQLNTDFNNIPINPAGPQVMEPQKRKPDQDQGTRDNQSSSLLKKRQPLCELKQQKITRNQSTSAPKEKGKEREKNKALKEANESLSETDTSSMLENRKPEKKAKPESKGDVETRAKVTFGFPMIFIWKEFKSRNSMKQSKSSRKWKKPTKQTEKPTKARNQLQKS